MAPADTGKGRIVVDAEQRGRVASITPDHSSIPAGAIFHC